MCGLQEEHNFTKNTISPTVFEISNIFEVFNMLALVFFVNVYTICYFTGIAYPKWLSNVSPHEIIFQEAVFEIIWRYICITLTRRHRTAKRSSQGENAVRGT